VTRKRKKKEPGGENSQIVCKKFGEVGEHGMEERRTLLFSNEDKTGDEKRGIFILNSQGKVPPFRRYAKRWRKGEGRGKTGKNEKWGRGMKMSGAGGGRLRNFYLGRGGGCRSP